MLKLTLLPEEYFTIDGGIVVQLIRAAGGHAEIAIEAPRELPILRGAVLERNGGKRPACLAAPSKKKPRSYRDQVFRWNDDRERAVRRMRQVLDQLDQKGLGEEAGSLRDQLSRIIPAVWEDDLAAQ